MISSVRVYQLGSHKIIPTQSVARAASYARMHVGDKIDILKDGRTVGMKEAGSDRINWVGDK
jgi:hypothetical protein